MNLTAARQRIGRFLTARATIERKVGETWAVVATDVPCAVEARREIGAGIDPLAAATAGDTASYDVTFGHGLALAEGDRLAIVMPDGNGDHPRLIVSGRRLESLAVATQVTATAEVTATETWVVVVERYDAASDGFVPVATVTGRVTGAAGATAGGSGQGAATTQHRATLILTDLEADVAVGDWLRGIPWARGARVERVHPAVGDRREVAFVYATGG